MKNSADLIVSLFLLGIFSLTTSKCLTLIQQQTNVLGEVTQVPSREIRPTRIPRPTFIPESTPMPTRDQRFCPVLTELVKKNCGLPSKPTKSTNQE